MDFITNPITLLLIIPIGIIAWFFLRELLKGGGSTEVTSKFLSLKRVDNTALVAKVDQLSTQVIRLQAKIDYIEKKDSLRYEYKSRLNKLNKKFYSHLLENSDSILGSKTGLPPMSYKALDEYRIMVLTIDDITQTITKKGMDDFDKNGFNTVGVNAEGIYDNKVHLQYVNTKPEEYYIEIRKHLVGIERPSTIIADPACRDDDDDFTPIDRKVLLPLDEFGIAINKSLREIEDDIKDLYDFIITRYRVIDAQYPQR